jgi:hypothetical protein
VPDYGFISNTASPMDAMGKMAATMNAINQNKLFLGKEMAGRAIQESIDPNTGAVDFQNVNRLISTNPKIAPYAQEALQQTLAAQGASTANTSAQQQLAGAYSAALFQDIAAAKTPEDAVTAIARGVTLGRYPQGFATSFVSGAPTNGRTFSDAMKALQDAGAIQSGSEAAMEARFGTPGAVDTGAQNVGVVTNRVTGERDLLAGDAAAITKTLGPESKSEMIKVIDPATKTEHLVPKSALVTGTGEAKSGAVNTQTSLAPGVSEAMSVAAQGSANMANALVQRASKVPDNKAILGNMEGLLTDMDSQQLGPQSPFWKKMGQIAAQYGVKLPGAPPKDKIAAQEEFSKLAFQLAQSQFQALGGTGTDSKLDSTMHTSPSELLTRYGNQGIIALLKGNEDAVQAQGNAWQKWQERGNGPETYSTFLNQWGKIYDPRVFQAQYMTPAARQTMLKGMTKAEQDNFQTAYKRAASLGWIQ